MADQQSGTSSKVRVEASIAGGDDAGNYTDVHWKLIFFEFIHATTPAFGSAYAFVNINQNGSPTSVFFTASFSFDWTPSGLQSVDPVAEGTTRIYHNADGTPPAAFSVTGGIGPTGSGGAGGPTEATQPLTLPTRKVVPGIPSSVAAVRNSDAQVTVSWLQSSASNGQPTSNTIRRKINGGAWADAALISPTTSAALAAAANQKLVFGVKAANSAGASDWSADSAPVYTTPGPPTGVTATKVGSDITVAWTPNVAFSEHEHVVEHGVDVLGVVTWDGSPLSTEPAGDSTATHSSPNPAQRHVYRVWAKNTDVAGLESTKVTSNVVQLLAAPAKPTVPAPAAFQDKAATFRFGWVHNPVDTTAQAKYQVRYSLDGGSIWTTGSKTSSSDQFADFAGGTFSADDAVTFQVRTKGGYDSGSDGDASYSPWSDSVTVTFKTLPEVTILAPADGGTWTEAELRVALAFDQDEGASFVQATIVLSDGVGDLETKVSNTLASTLLATQVENGGSYTVTVTVVDSNGLTSAPVEADFDVAYTLPVEAGVTIVYHPDSGVAQLMLTIPDAEGGEADAVAVTIFRTIDGVRETVTAAYPVEVGEWTILDTTPTIHGSNTYTVRTISEDGATADVTAELETSEGSWGFLSTGPGWSNIVAFYSNLVTSSAPGRDSALVRTAGRVNPIALFGEGQSLAVSGSVTIVPGEGSSWQDIETFIREAEVVCFRDPSGRRVFGLLTGSISGVDAVGADLSFTIVEAA